MFSQSAEFVPVALASTQDVCQERAVHPAQVVGVRRNLLSTHEATRIAALFAVLSDPTRLQVVHALFAAPTGELCVCDIAAGLGRDDTTISHQLRVLRNQQIVAMRKVGRSVYYRLVDEHIRQLLKMGIEHIHENASSLLMRETEVTHG
jgi:DNA-binding transcriptional ArsR family regulator